MMANEQDYQPRAAAPAPPHPHHPLAPARSVDRQAVLQDRIAELIGSCSPGNQFIDAASSDMRLTLRVAELIGRRCSLPTFLHLRQHCAPRPPPQDLMSTSKGRSLASAEYFLFSWSSLELDILHFRKKHRRPAKQVVNREFLNMI